MLLPKPEICALQVQVVSVSHAERCFAKEKASHLKNRCEAGESFLGRGTLFLVGEGTQLMAAKFAIDLKGT